MQGVNLRVVGMIAGAIGGGVCILAGLVSLLLGLLASQATFGSTIPPGLYWALGLYFIGKGCFAAGISFTTGWSSQQKATTASGPSPTPSAP